VTSLAKLIQLVLNRRWKRIPTIVDDIVNWRPPPSRDGAKGHLGGAAKAVGVFHKGGVAKKTAPNVKTEGA
jgi:hypothetical protein